VAKASATIRVSTDLAGCSTHPGKASGSDIAQQVDLQERKVAGWKDAPPCNSATTHKFPDSLADGAPDVRLSERGGF
jgi:hypothetical protein